MTTDRDRGKKNKRAAASGAKAKPKRIVPAPWFIHEACVIGTGDLQPRSTECGTTPGPTQQQGDTPARAQPLPGPQRSRTSASTATTRKKEKDMTGPEQLHLSGYEQHKEVMAQRYRMGKVNWVYLISLPIQLIPTHLPLPNPDEPFPGNRRVNRRHAEGFGKYWRDNPENWACPPLMLDTLLPLKEGFNSRLEVGGVEFGVLKLPHNSAAELQILDGQHRILGWKLAADEIAEDLRRAREQLQASKRIEDEVGIHSSTQAILRLTEQQERLAREFVTVEILEGVGSDAHRQYFSDIANNAKGITKSVTTSFDRRSVLNRVTMDLAEGDDLLAGRVEMEKDRVVGPNSNLLSGRNLADIVRHTVLGIDGRMTARREAELKESAVHDIAEQFFRALGAGFADLTRLQDEDLSAQELRDKSLLGSATVLRCLAGAYHALAVDLTDERRAHVTSKGHEAAVALFSELSDHMSFPVENGWLETGLFSTADAKAPSSRAQDLKKLTAQIASWATDGVPF